MSDASEKSPTFGEYARYYDLIYRDKDYASEVDYIARLIHKFNPGAKSILELGSGTGIHADLLAARGFSVHGIERSLEMLARSRPLIEKHKRDHVSSTLMFTEGDIRAARLNKMFDVVISLFHVISYQTDNADVSAAFATAREHLKPGGVFIFDVWYGPAVLTDPPAVRVKRIADDQTAVTRIAEPVVHLNDNLVTVNYHLFVRNLQSGSVKEIRESHLMRYFFKPEVQWVGLQTKLKYIHSEEWLSGKAIGCDTWGVCFVLQPMD